MRGGESRECKRDRGRRGEGESKFVITTHLLSNELKSFNKSLS